MRVIAATVIKSCKTSENPQQRAALSLRRRLLRQEVCFDGHESNVIVVSASAQYLTVPHSFCRKSTLHKHIERDHPRLASSRTDEDDWYDDTEVSPTTPGGDAASEVPRSAPSESIVSPFTTLPSQNFSAQQRQQQQVSRSPFTTVRQRGTPDPSYRNYPHPNLSMGQVQNLSSADVRGYPSQAMVSPPNLAHSRQNSASHIATWHSHNDPSAAPMSLPMQNSANVVAQRAIVRDNFNEYAPRSAPIDLHQTRLLYNNDHNITGAPKHEHRRSASDASGMVYSQQQRDFGQRHSIDAVHFNEQQMHAHSCTYSHQQHQLQKQQQQQASHNSEPPQLYREPQFLQTPNDYPQLPEQVQHQVPQQQPQTNYDAIVPTGYENQSFEAYEEPQNLGIVGQTYRIPIGYDLGITAAGLDEDKYLDTFGEPLPSTQLSQ
ncbi:MAG: hypothetical protein MMC23_007692 [Stictis urceolatum]|nr:hypothetical protein [Stictis urceolata]